MNQLDFEKPIGELMEQLEKTRQIADKGKVDVKKIIEELEKKLKIHGKKYTATCRHGRKCSFHVIPIDLIP